MPFGKHKGKTLDQIAETDDGLLYLDWLSDQKLDRYLRTSVDVYLADDAIQRDLRELTAKPEWFD
jgi:hypothetical protein